MICQGLDNFNITEQFETTSTNNSLSFIFRSTDLPRESYGKIFIKCTNRIDFKFECNTTDLNVFICVCNQLSYSNSKYKIMLINEKSGFTSVEKLVSKEFYTSEHKNYPI